ncbi:hypothetical protein [Nocardia sp. NPDC020380]|uniref:hypothetical protein n=1 Tax=Nocardia sp. NPDC020380 TaxID=3364309 RepID=UPI0037B50A18
MHARSYIVLPAALLALALSGCSHDSASTASPTTAAAAATSATAAKTGYGSDDIAQACKTMQDYESKAKAVSDPAAPDLTDKQKVDGAINLIASASEASGKPMSPDDVTKMRDLYTAAAATGCK